MTWKCRQERTGISEARLTCSVLLEMVVLLLGKIKIMSIYVFSVPVGVGAVFDISCQSLAITRVCQSLLLFFFFLKLVPALARSSQLPSIQFEMFGDCFKCWNEFSGKSFWLGYVGMKYFPTLCFSQVCHSPHTENSQLTMKMKEWKTFTRQCMYPKSPLTRYLL